MIPREQLTETQAGTSGLHEVSRETEGRESEHLSNTGLRFWTYGDSPTSVVVNNVENGPETITAVQIQQPTAYASLRHDMDVIQYKERMARYGAVTDPVALYLLKILVENDGLSTSELDDVLANGVGWARLIRLSQAGLADLVGDFIEVTEEGRKSYEEVSKYMGVQP